jgi:glycosyltransferase involved in cell wall biosynthesis
MKIALIHEWLTKPGGSEQVLSHLAQLFPDAPIYCLVHRPGVEKLYGIDPARIRPSFVQKLPGAVRHYRKFLPLYPRAVESHDLSGFDLVIANHHCVAHGARVKNGATLISYCHTPMRYAWELRDDYLAGAKLHRGLKGKLAHTMLNRLQKWDHAAAQRPAKIIANSGNVAQRVMRWYHRKADFIYPAVEVAKFFPPAAAPKRGEHFLVLSRLVNYKKIDAAIALANKDKLPLRIAGEGPERRRLERLAGPTVKFLGRLDEKAVIQELQSARALLFPGEEDFGLTAVEALASGCPVIHSGTGGAAEIAAEVLGNQGAGMTMEKLGENRKEMDTQLKEAAAQLAEPAMRGQLEKLFGLERFNAAWKDVVKAAG